MTFSEGMARGPVAMLEGRAALLRLWREYRDIAWAHGLPFFATTPTRRANRARMERAGHGPELIAQNVALLRSLAQGGPMCVGGLMGCRGDAYTGEGALPRQEARAFHRWQAEAFRRAGADFLLAGSCPPRRRPRAWPRPWPKPACPMCSAARSAGMDAWSTARACAT